MNYNPYNIKEIADHDAKLVAAHSDYTYEGMKILIFQPVAAGDNIVASLGAELLHIKYPGCKVDFFTTLHESESLLKHNPYINQVIVNKDWELFNTRATASKGSVPGTLRKEYDLAYGLYWWNAPMVESFLQDMELPTDYTHVRLYTPDLREVIDNQALICNLTLTKEYKKIALQNKESLRKVWNVDKEYDKLLKELRELGIVFEIGAGCGLDFLQTACLLEHCDLLVGYHGSQEHMAAAVNCQTVVISREWNPKDALTAYYQNKYMPANRQHRVVRPKKWCENFERCITYNPNEFVHKLPPYGFPNKFPPHKHKDCDFGFEKSCVYEITAEDVLEQVRIALNGLS
jgi:ADP-heptose:LPS heptosyltransferase